MKHLFLFDVDSVLVEANGYLRALQDTVRHFSRQMGLGDHAPTEAEVRAGEAHGLTSEWDSAPTYIAALLIERLRQSPALLPFSDWNDTVTALNAQPLTLAHSDYAAWAARIGARLSQGACTASQAARAVMVAAATALSPEQQVALLPLLDTLFAHTHEFEHAPITQYFQHLIIGSAKIQQTYGVAPAFSSPAYLETYDVALLDANTRTQLRARQAQADLGVVLYTARPSLPPADVEASQLGYSPEAELARSLVGLEDWPLVGLGHVRWLGQRVGVDVEALVKPSPVQALAAIGAALSGQEAAALDAAWHLYHAGEIKPPLNGAPEITVSVFEDSPAGLRAVQQAVRLLNQAGVSVVYCPYGITPATGAKAEIMTAMDVPIYRIVNEAARAALKM